MRGVLLVPVAVGTGSGFEKGSAAGGSGAGLLDVAVGTLAAGGTGGGTGAGLLDVAVGGSLTGGPTGTRRATDFCGFTDDALGFSMMIGSSSKQRTPEPAMRRGEADDGQRPEGALLKSGAVHSLGSFELVTVWALPLEGARALVRPAIGHRSYDWKRAS